MTEIERLQEENEMLRERVEELNKVLDDVRGLPPEWKLSRQQTRLMNLLLRRHSAAAEDIRAALYRDYLGDPPDSESLPSVMMCKLRRKLRPFGWSIETLWGYGYALPEEQKRAIRAGEVAR